MDVVQYCRACLITDVKMYSLAVIARTYSQLTQVPVYDEAKQHICFECVWLLQKYKDFQSKCLRTHNILMNIYKNTQVTAQTIQNIDRKKNKLTTNLILTAVSVSYEKSNDTIDGKDGEFKDINEPSRVHVDIKIEPISDFDVDNKSDFNDLYDNPEDNITYSSVESKPAKVSRLKHKSKHEKEPTARKKKLKRNNIKNEKDDLSDDEPLSKSIIKSKDAHNRFKKKNGLNTGYFDDYATVVFLTPEDARKEVLLRKESSNYKKSPFKCDMCYRGYEAKAAFDNHMKKHSSEYGEYECDLCHLRFPQQIYLCKHKLSCHKRKFICKLCPYVCYCTYQAKTHVSLHKGKKYPCKDCNEVFSMPNSLLMHKRMKHLLESVRESVCEHCGGTFGTQRGLFLHTMKVHRQDKNGKLGPECKECDVHFSSEMAWKRHLVLSSKHNVSNGCKCCGETFSTTEDLKSHMKVHSRKHIHRFDNVKLPAACEICNKWLSTRGEYKAHMSSQHPFSDEAKRLIAEDQTPFVCEVCGQMFKQQCFLTYHQRKHTGERPYKCEDCGKTFQLAGALSIHKTVHTRKRSYKCDMCARVFTFKSALNKHIKVHLGIRPHKCALCDKGFIHKCDLRLHIKYVHDKVPWPKKKPKRNSHDETAFEYNI